MHGELPLLKVVDRIDPPQATQRAGFLVPDRRNLQEVIPSSAVHGETGAKPHMAGRGLIFGSTYNSFGAMARPSGSESGR
jgi:hypothetical protein